MQALTSLHELGDLVKDLPRADTHARDVAEERQKILTKPAGSLGRLEEIAVWLASWQGRSRPKVDKCQTIIFAGNHGVAARGVSAFPPAVTEQMVANFRNGGAAINQLCKSVGSDLDVHPIQLDTPTLDFSSAPAMSEEACLQALNIGINAVSSQSDLIALGEMGIGNTTAAAALCCALFGGDPSLWVGRGTGIDDASLALKAELIRAALSLHGRQLDDPKAVIRYLGGRELAAILGSTLSARYHRIPVLLDGFVCTAAAAPLAAIAHGALDHCLVGHSSVEPGHGRLIQKLGKTALLDLDMRLGEASGAALAMAVIKSAVGVHNGMATFAEAGVSENQN